MSLMPSTSVFLGGFKHFKNSIISLPPCGFDSFCSRLILRNFPPIFVTQTAEVHHHKEVHNWERFIGLKRSNNRRPNRHWDPRWRAARGRKFIKLDLPDMDQNREKDTTSIEQMRKLLKAEGIPPVERRDTDRPMLVSSTSEIIDPYEVPEGDGVFSSMPSNLQERGFVSSAANTALRKDARAVRKIKNYLESWSKDEFAEEAVDIYIRAHEALQERDSETLHKLVTEKAYPEMWKTVKLRSIRWKFIENLEAPKVVRVRTAAQITKDNFYAQVTVRIYSKQTLAVYDQFGRLILGSETIEIPVVDHVVYENHLVNQYGSWRIHGKLFSSEQLKKQRNYKPTFKVKVEDKYEELPDNVDKWIDPDEEEERTNDRTKDVANQ